MNFSSNKTVVSASHPEVSFTVRVLSKLERTKRDAALLKARFDAAKLLQQLKSLMDGDGKDAKIREGYELEASEVEVQMNQILESDIKPTVIRHGLISVDGFSVDGREVIRPDEFANVAPEDLFEEAYDACQEAAGLTEEALKNSSSPTTSAGAEPVEASNTTASSVSAPAGI
jgi:hypothetical protein